MQKPPELDFEAFLKIHLLFSEASTSSKYFSLGIFVKPTAYSESKQCKVPHSLNSTISLFFEAEKRSFYLFFLIDSLISILQNNF